MSDENRPLTPKERAFCEHFVAQGCTNGTQAAIKAGYSAKSAAVTASRLRADPRIQAEIERLKGPVKSAALVVIDAALGAARMAREGQPVDPHLIAAREEAERDVAAGLNRAYVIAGLIDLYEICLARRPVKTTKVVRKVEKGADGIVSIAYEGIQIDTFQVDSAGARGAADLLIDECNRLDKLAGLNMPEETREDSLADAMRKFREIAGVPEPPKGGSK